MNVDYNALAEQYAEYIRKYTGFHVDVTYVFNNDCYGMRVYKSNGEKAFMLVAEEDLQEYSKSDKYMKDAAEYQAESFGLV
ncbi:hypothetical protein SEA_MOAB_7 [Streptomyces phage Moab]|nr:hypothetical protein SEA_MOAB_7 [Streptomyces phage Moab]WMI33644.1 hypothetical protein SEA_PATELGO_8 [Streptomyces phage Patelgo]